MKHSEPPPRKLSEGFDREANRHLRQQRIDLLTVLTGPSLFLGAAVGGWNMAREQGLSASLLLPLAVILAVGAFGWMRWRRWSSTRGHTPGKHRG